MKRQISGLRTAIALRYAEKRPGLADKTIRNLKSSECNGKEGYEEYKILAGTWTIFRGRGKLPMSLVNAEMYAFMEWLPNSGYEHAFAPELEVYVAGERDVVEFWLPIRKK